MKKKTEFIQSKVTSNLFLIKNIPTDNSLLKNDIINFLIKNPTEYEKKPFHINFYRYTSKTKYFLDNVPDYSGGFADEI